VTVLRLEPALLDGDAQALTLALVRALQALPPGSLPLGAVCRQGGLVDERDLAFSVLSLNATDARISARVGVFFGEVLGGCNCSDDPVVFNAYGVLLIAIDRVTGVASISPDAD